MAGTDVRLGLEPLEKPVQGLLVILAGDLRVTRVDQLVVAELLERQEHVAMGLGLVGVLRGDFPAEPKRLLEMLAAGLRVAEGDAQVAELVAKPGAFAADLDLIGQGGRELVAQRDLFAIAVASLGRVAQLQAGAGDGTEDIGHATLRLVVGRLARQPLPAKDEGLVEELEGGLGVADPVHLEVAEGGLDAGLDLLRFERVGVGGGQLLGQLLHAAEVAGGLVVLAVFHRDQPRALVDPGQRPSAESESLLVAGHRTELLQRGDCGLESGQRRVDQLFAQALRPRDREQPLVQQDAEHSLGLQRVSVLGEGPLHERLGFLAGLLLLLACQGLGLRGCDRLVLGRDRRLLVRLARFREPLLPPCTTWRVLR